MNDNLRLNNINILILIPAYNEEKTIERVIHKIPKNLSGFNKISCIVINDGSSDNTEYIAKNAGAEVISHPYNKGVGSAFQTGST